MKCEDVRERMIDAFDGEEIKTLSPEVQAHLNECADCGNQIRELSSVWRDLGNLQVPAMSEASATRILDSLATQLAGPRRTSRPVRRQMLAAAALLAAALAGALLSRTETALSIFPMTTQSTVNELDLETLVSNEAGGGTYLLLLHRPDQFAVSGRADRYQEWADNLRASNQLVGAGALQSTEGWMLSRPASNMTSTRLPAPVGDVEGFFLITARDSTDVIEAARISPHFDYGGTIEVRRVVN